MTRSEIPAPVLIKDNHMKIMFAAPENAWGGFLGLIRDKLPQHHFEPAGKFEVDDLKGYDVLIPTMCPVSRTLLQTGDPLKLIQQCGAGLEGVDLAAARQMNIPVANVPTDISGNADSVAELGIYMMIGLSRNFKAMAENFIARKSGQPQGQALGGRTVGLIGLGGIGKALIQRLRPFGVHIIGLKRHAPQNAMRELGLDWVGGTEDLHELLRRSDFVILAIPYSAKNRYIINQTNIGFMKDTAFLINLARGGLIEYEALKTALSTRKIAGAGLDVFWEEPPDPDDDIFNYNLLATPHIGGSTDVSMQGIVKAVAENIRRLESGRKPLYLNA